MTRGTGLKILVLLAGTIFLNVGSKLGRGKKTVGALTKRVATIQHALRTGDEKG